MQVALACRWSVAPFKSLLTHEVSCWGYEPWAGGYGGGSKPMVPVWVLEPILAGIESDVH